MDNVTIKSNEKPREILSVIYLTNVHIVAELLCLTLESNN